ncbi:hypothetical protein [Paenibacillus illinoisensis]|uniref:Uncharacterized protein n=1 Tax=Paenibacillus illinoisensis TaxID=59845 RepID=A0A2W0C7E6_9BACL|nr:hypothetical protein [Paenibacillus illinoisensis]PYY25902.1 hypothetical protein PIL02S_05271 [Paenibacillus illinoisensis]
MDAYKFSFIGAIILLVILGATYINNVGYNNVKLMYKLNTTEVSIVQMDEEGQYLGLRMNSNQILKDRMEREGWQFKQQEGAAFFFKKDNKEAIISTEIWNSNYVLYRVDNNVVIIADNQVQQTP